MGRATRWLKSLFTGKKSNSAVSSTPDRKKWGLIGKSFRQKGEPPPSPQMASRVNEERRGSYREVMSIEDEDEQNKHAIAVAAATAAVAEAAVAAAHAAAAVVRLTSSGRCVASRREEIAVIKIQSAFRGYLARRALKALRGLVKLQALVRGNIVRKQAAEALRCMHALLRVQAQARASRAGLSQRCRSERALRVSSANSGPPTPEKSDQPTRSNGSRSDRSSPLKRNSTKSTANSRVDRDRTHSSQRNWLDQWMDEKYYNDDKHTKILEIDSGKPIPGFSKNSPSKDSTIPQLSPNSVTSPHFYSATSLSRRSPFTPTKSECSFGGYSDYPNYMANTESFRMKSRSQSAPRQRLDCEKSGTRVPSLTSRSIQAKFAKKAYPGSGRLNRLGMPVLRH
ncbi:hypothetical protein LUZ60_016419 [Juncus effusus]|nr:hypothetical protein LUZ60_016419 [Juncus effusus]